MSNVENEASLAGGDTGGLAALPKHIPFPEVPNMSELTNELITLLFILFSAGMQFIHIYRTGWWIPDSYMNQAINFYLIDAYLVLFITVIVTRRFFYCLTMKLLEMSCNDKVLKSRKFLAKCIFVTTLFGMLSICITKLYVKQNYLCLFLLVYPLVVYFLIFGLQIEPFLRVTNEIEASYLNGIPMHCCSTNPSSVRDEIEVLKNDFNSRMKQVVFTSVINAYYAGFVPCFFAQNFMYYDVMWVTQHIIFVWLGGFTMCTAFCFPAKYCDVMHRAALHLGLWSRIDGRVNNNQPPGTWSKTTAWASGSVIRHSGDLYRSSGPVTAAIPGNATHYRYYKLFSNPSMMYMVLTGIQTFLVVLQILLLCFSVEWHNIISLSFLTLTNHHTLFKIVRDYLVTQKVYAAEKSIYEKLSSHFS